MSLKVALALLVPLLLGFLLVSGLWFDRRVFRQIGLKLTLALGLGLGLTSCLFFAWLILPAHGIGLLLGAEIALIVLGVLLLYLRRTRDTAEELQANPFALSGGSRRLFSAGFVLLFLSGTGAFLADALSQPHGGWDAWSIWNMRARFLFRGAAHWTDAFSEHLFRFHPDYPLLLPGSVAQGWFFAGTDTIAIPILLAAAFTLGTVLLLFFALSAVRNEARGLLAALILLTTPFFLSHGAAQFADVPLGFFCLAATVLVCLQDRLPPGRYGLLALAGLSAGLAAWTKNEGLVFLIGLAAARLVVIWRARGLRACRKEAPWFLAGVLPALAAVVVFKLCYATTNDLVAAGGSSEALTRLVTVSRYVQIGKEFIRQAFTFGQWSQLTPVPLCPVGLLIGYLLIFGIRLEERERTGAATAFIALCLVLAGDFGAFLITPVDLSWHLGTACNRLFLQLWPSFLFLCFMVMPAPSSTRS